MSVFGSIKDFLFGKKFVSFKKPGATPAQASPAPSAVNASQTTPSSAVAQPQAQPQTQTPSAPAERVDIAGILDQEARESGQTLNWRQSIVDLMKLCGIDSSLQNRKALAHELGYTGNTDDSAAMNIWLHRQVLQKLEESGGVVPADLKD